MRAAVFQETNEPLVISDVERPEPDPDGVIVETEACGICRSDWHVWRGDWSHMGNSIEKGQILGHEPAGTVIETGEEVTQFEEGDQVAIPFNLADGTCHMCLEGKSNLCANGQSLGFHKGVQGAWAEYVHVPKAHVNAVQTPDDVSPAEMAALGCRYMTAFHALAHQAEVSAGDRVAIHGCGGVGQSAIQIANALGANVVAVDITQDKLQRADELGAEATVNGGEIDDVPKAVKDITDGGVDISIDALGIEETCRNSVQSVRETGTHVQVGISTQAEQGTIPLPTDTIALNEIEFIGSKGMQATKYEEIFRMIESGKLDPELIISDRVDLSETSDVLFAMDNFETTGISVITSF
ncbi:zinc-binding dehydrogenase [Halobellus sp. GM3]|uniref:zinc-binding dehydrogenase n=1 Tax=Halobellus sp. GM3 TaxID=3458410 RepID=UPI00403DC5D9